MPGVTGREVKAAYARSNTWGTPASVTKQILLTSTDGLESSPALVDDDAFNQDFLASAEVGDYPPVNTDLPLQLRYETVDVWLAAAMGSAAAPTVVSSVAANSLIAYQHIVTLATELTNFFTLAVDVGNPSQFVLSVPTAKIKGYTLRVGDNGRMMVNFAITGNKTSYADGVNTNSTVAGAAVASIGNRVFRKNGRYRVNLQSAGALATATDAINSLVGEVTFGSTRPLAEDPALGQDYIVEPDDNGFAEFPVDIGFNRMNTVTANSLAIGLQAGQNFKADIFFQGTYINSTTQRSLLWEFPNLQCITFKAPVTGHNQVKPTASFRAKLAVTSPTGMAFVSPMRLTIVNMNSLNLLT